MKLIVGKYVDLARARLKLRDYDGPNSTSGGPARFPKPIKGCLKPGTN